MARLSVPSGPGGEATMIWTLRPQLGGMVERMIRGAYEHVRETIDLALANSIGRDRAN